MQTMNPQKPTTDRAEVPTIVMNASNLLLGVVIALLVCLGAFLAGMQFQTSKRADCSVRVVDANFQTGHVVVTPNGGVYYVYNDGTKRADWKTLTLIAPPR